MTSLPGCVSGSAARPMLLGALLAGVAFFAGCNRPPKETARQFYREASGAFEDGDNAGALSLMQKAAALRPRDPRYLIALARLQSINNRPLDAIATLDQIARMGLSLHLEQDETFAPLRGFNAFDDVVRRLRANRAPRGAETVLFELPQMTGIIEGIAQQPRTGDYFFSDVHHRCVWVRQVDGTVRRFSPSGAGLLAVMGLAVDETRGSLWATTAALPQMDDYKPADRNHGALVELALADGSIRRIAPLPTDGAAHELGHLTVASDGTVYASDSMSPIIWRLAPRAQKPVAWLRSDKFESLQDLVLMPDGRTLLAADAANGLLAVDLASRSARVLVPPPDTTLVGIDGLTLLPDGSVIAVQNGIEPRRVVRLWLDPTLQNVLKLEVLECGHSAMADPTEGTLVENRYVFIGDSGWDRFVANESGAASTPRAVPILATRLPSQYRSQ